MIVRLITLAHLYFIQTNDLFIENISCNCFKADGLMKANVRGDDNSIKIKCSIFDFHRRTGIAVVSLLL